MSTLREIVQDALSVLGEVDGPGVSTYSEDRMMADAVRSFNLLSKKYYWPHLLQWFTVPLDGVNGVVPADTFKFVRNIEDIHSVYKHGNPNPLNVLSKMINPSTIRGTELQYWSFLPVTSPLFANRYIQCWPKTSTDSIDVLARVYPRENGEKWAWEDEVPLDHDMLVNGTAFLTLSSDDINPGAADTQRNLMEMRYQDILATFSDKPITVRRSGASIPQSWFVPNG